MSIHEEDVGTAELLARCREAQALADKSSAELAEALRMHRLNVLAEQLTAEFGECGLPRAVLVEWLGGQIERVKLAGVPGGDLATAMLDSAFLELQAKVCGSAH